LLHEDKLLASTFSLIKFHHRLCGRPATAKKVQDEIIPGNGKLPKLLQ